MAQIANTFSTVDVVGQREELRNAIYDISPEEKPFVSAIGVESLKSKHPEWQTDGLAAANTANASLEGDEETTFTAATPTVRVGNHAQISKKVFLVSGTNVVTEKAGRGSELAYQIAKSGRELLRDIEAGQCQASASVARDDTANPGRSASLESWITTNGSRGAGGADGGFQVGTGLVTAPTDGTLRNLTEEMFQQAAQDAWQAGGNPTMVLCGGNHKRAISKFNNATAGGTPTVTRFDDNDDSRLVTSIDVYKHDFGVLRVAPSRFCRTRTISIIDPSLWSIGYLRSFHVEALAKTGDAHKRVIRVEYALVSRNEAGNATIADLN